MPAGVTTLLRSLFFLLFLFAVPASAAAPPATWPLEHFVQWQPEWGNKTIEAGGLRVRTVMRRCGETRPVSEACSPGSRYLVAVVSGGRMATTTLVGQPGSAAYLGIGKLTPDAKMSSVILISHSGASAGCVTIDLAVPEGRVFRSAKLAAEGSDSLCAVDPEMLEWPRDLAGRSRAEFVLRDTAFHCRFTSCAASRLPPRVIAFVHGDSVDVSRDPALAPLYRREMAAMRDACEQERDEAQGACAAYAADAARLGLLSEAWTVIEAQVQRGCRVARPEDCADATRIPEAFPAALASVLSTQGYR
ncbi:hypothetical protein E2493_05745 [Sphingomonas parva]|uniref:DUF1311 domain-containing protein n=1 Tax=Sphingomonas parva TaxID=2555898 RepID=A0A4Y8ZTK0_9SPHN|nr:hypothetical protein [Sphingomonas parva]TFI59340.1 hypothetical protein E2493_05745 [Sphingomonas parva]